MSPPRFRTLTLMIGVGGIKGTMALIAVALRRLDFHHSYLTFG